MTEQAGEAVLGPRPGRAIVSFWQGSVEIGLRAAAAFLGVLPALIAAAVALVTATNDDISDAIWTDPDLEDLREDTYTVTGFVIGITGLVFIIQILVIVVRFCNIGLINLKIIYFHVIDIVLNIIFGVSLAAGGVALAVYAPNWDDYFNNNYDPIDAERIHNSMIASAAFCFLGFILFFMLAVWMMIFAAMKKNYEVMKYTLKDSIAVL